MLYQFITIYTSDFWMTMLLGVLAFLCLPVVTGEISQFFQTDNATRLIPVASDSVFAGEQEGTTEYKVCMMPHIFQTKFLIRNYSHWLG